MKILILAPHPDDEVLMTAGIITKTLASGHYLKVVVVSNGDYGAAPNDLMKGHIRLSESVDGLMYLGVKAADIVFLGYGDTGMSLSDSFLYRIYSAISDDLLVSSHCGTRTYAIQNKYPDYHLARFGEHGRYTRATFRKDIESVINEYRPAEIYVTGFYDTHGDHHALNLFTVESVLKIKKYYDNEYSPIMYEYLIHPPGGKDVYPTREADDDPMVTFSKPAVLGMKTNCDWQKRISVPVPIDMQTVPRSSKNKKYETLCKYRSQVNDRILSFVKADEVFWAKHFSNIAPLAQVSVSSEKLLTGQLGIKAVDGFNEGYPRHSHLEWVADGECAGAWIKLNWSRNYIINKVVLCDRPNLNDNILSGILNFNDGTTIHVGRLPNGGTPYEVSFKPKIVNWLSFTIEAFSGLNAGLSEIEVYQESLII